MKRIAPAVFALLLPALSSEAQVGDVTFETSASPEAEEHFLRGVAILHSFGFEDASESFRKAQELEPDFAPAYWGEAMAHGGNPLSSPTQQDLSAARAALEKLGRTRADRVGEAKTEWKKMWMEAVELLSVPAMSSWIRAHTSGAWARDERRGSRRYSRRLPHS